MTMDSGRAGWARQPSVGGVLQRESETLVTELNFAGSRIIIAETGTSREETRVPSNVLDQPRRNLICVGDRIDPTRVRQTQNLPSWNIVRVDRVEIN